MGVEATQLVASPARLRDFAGKTDKADHHSGRVEQGRLDGPEHPRDAVPSGEGFLELDGAEFLHDPEVVAAYSLLLLRTLGPLRHLCSHEAIRRQANHRLDRGVDVEESAPKSFA